MFINRSNIDFFKSCYGFRLFSLNIVDREMQRTGDFTYGLSCQIVSVQDGALRFRQCIQQLAGTVILSHVLALPLITLLSAIRYLYGEL